LRARGVFTGDFGKQSFAHHGGVAQGARQFKAGVALVGLAGIGFVELDGHRVAFQAGLVGFIAPETNTSTFIFDTIHHCVTDEHTATINPHGIEGLHPVFFGQRQSDFTDRFCIEQISCCTGFLRNGQQG
jgi:hypothetical protein